MKPKQIFITAFDKTRLEGLIAAGSGGDGEDRRHLEDLERELERAVVVEPHDVPADVVTMNSQVRFRDLDTLEQMTYRLVFPKDADVDAGAISVLAPVGTALLGHSEGSTVEWMVPSGRRRLEIVQILYQPEAAGDYRL
jgi:regulator of nucleoside diphosphate kinase